MHTQLIAFGHRFTTCFCAAYFIGAGLQAGSHSNTLSMIFLGRIFWGIGVGFGDHCELLSPAQKGCGLLFANCCKQHVIWCGTALSTLRAIGNT